MNYYGFTVAFNDTKNHELRQISLSASQNKFQSNGSLDHCFKFYSEFSVIEKYFLKNFFSTLASFFKWLWTQNSLKFKISNHNLDGLLKNGNIEQNGNLQQKLDLNHSFEKN